MLIGSDTVKILFQQHKSQGDLVLAQMQAAPAPNQSQTEHSDADEQTAGGDQAADNRQDQQIVEQYDEQKITEHGSQSQAEALDHYQLFPQRAIALNQIGDLIERMIRMTSIVRVVFHKDVK